MGHDGIRVGRKTYLVDPAGGNRFDHDREFVLLQRGSRGGRLRREKTCRALGCERITARSWKGFHHARTRAGFQQPESEDRTGQPVAQSSKCAA
jgi:hypothetical protein